MQPKNNLRPEAAKLWLEKAKHDLDTGILNQLHNGWTDITCYLAHQTAEKSLKAFLVFSSIKFRKVHDLNELLELCKQRNGDFSELEQTCIVLNRYYFEAKYPLDPPVDYSKEEAQEAINIAQEIFDFVKKKIEG